jgi:hypothetical protein
MADEKIEHYITIPGRRGIVRVLTSPRPQAPAAAPLPGDGEPEGGYLPPSYRPDDDIPVQAQPFLTFYDLGTSLNPSGTPSYSERKGLLPLVLIPEIGYTYTDADWAALEQETLGALLSGDSEDDDPLGTFPIEESGRKASMVWPYNLRGMDDFPPLFGLYARSGKDYPDVHPTADRNWRPRDIDEVWAPINTEHDLAPDWGRWKVPGYSVYDHVRLDDGRYMDFDTRDVAHFRITRLPSNSAPVVPFKIGWPLKVYAMPRPYWVEEASFASTFGIAERVTVEILGTGTGINGPYRVEKTTRYSCRMPDPGIVAQHYLSESGHYDLARLPLFPQPFILGEGPPDAEYFVAHHLPPSSLKMVRSLQLRIEKHVAWDTFRIFSFFSVHVDSGHIVTPRTVDVVENTTRRVQDSALLEAQLRDRVAAEVATDIGPGPYSTYAFNFHQFPEPPNFQFFGTQPRSGQFCAIIVAGGKKYFVWRV